MTKVIVILILFELKHFLCDWVFQTEYMAAGKCRLHGWLMPLLSHAGLHAVGTFAVMLIVSRSIRVAAFLAVFDLICHFTIDRIKSSPNMFGTYKTQDRWFWILLGADQAAHHLTYFFIVFAYFKQLYF